MLVRNRAPRVRSWNQQTQLDLRIVCGVDGCGSNGSNRFRNGSVDGCGWNNSNGFRNGSVLGCGWNGSNGFRNGSVHVEASRILAIRSPAWPSPYGLGAGSGPV